MSSTRNYFYLIISLLVSALGFGRSFLFMSHIDLASVGEISFMQTLVMLVGFLQLGLISGGYRLYASDQPDKNKVNDAVIIYLAVVFAITIFPLILVKSVWRFTDVGFEVVLIGVTAGFFTLFSNWFSNTLIADQKLIMSSLINLAAAVISFYLIWIYIDQNVTILLMVLALQPLLILVMALALNPKLRLSALVLEFDVLKKTFKLGIIPFTVSLFLLVIYQIERWAIFGVLGTESLGHYYLVIMYTSIFMLLPASLLNLHYPRLVRAYEGRERSICRSILRRYLFELLVYLGFVVIITITTMSFFIDMFLPKYSNIQGLVIISLPGLVSLALSDVATLLFLTANRLHYIFNAGIMMLVSYLLLLSVFVFLDLLTLQSAAYIRSGALFIGLIALMAQLLVESRSSSYHWLRV